MFHSAEIDLNAPALIPDDYLPDVHSRLLIYKRIANAGNSDELRELQVEMIDRFGLLPDQIKNLFAITSLKLQASPLGIKKIELGDKGGRFTFIPEPDIDPMKLITLIQTRPSEFKFDGQERLKIEKSLKDFASRENFVKELLAHLSL